MDKWFLPTLDWAYVYLSMLGLSSSCKGGPGRGCIHVSFVVFGYYPTLYKYYRFTSHPHSIPVPVKQHWRMWVKLSFESTTGTPNKTMHKKPRAYFMIILCVDRHPWYAHWHAHILAHTHVYYVLTNSPLDKITAFSQTTISNEFSRMKINELQLEFHWILFLRVQLTIFQHWFDNGLAPTRRQAIIWTNGG